MGDICVMEVFMEKTEKFAEFGALYNVDGLIENP